MSNIPGVPEAERVCDNCMRPYCPYARRDTTCPSPEDFRETVDSLRKRAEAIIAELQAAVNGLAHTCDHLEDDRDYNAGLVAEVTKERDEARVQTVAGLSHKVLTVYGAPDKPGLTLLGRIEALADKSDRNGDRREQAERERDVARTRIDELEKLYLTREHNEADAAWQAAQGRIAHICQLLGVDFTCEEPETCEQVIERLLVMPGLERVIEKQRGQLAAMRDGIKHIACGLESFKFDEVFGAALLRNLVYSREVSDAGKPEADVIRAARAVWKEWRARPGDALYPDRVLFCKLGQALECLDGKGGGS